MKCSLVILIFLLTKPEFIDQSRPVMTKAITVKYHPALFIHGYDKACTSLLDISDRVIETEGQLDLGTGTR